MTSELYIMEKYQNRSFKVLMKQNVYFKCMHLFVLFEIYQHSVL